MDTKSSKRSAARAKAPVQPIEAATNPAALLHPEVVYTLTGRRRTTTYNAVKAGTFPPPVMLSPRCARWRAGDVMAWLERQSTAQGVPA